MTKEERKEYQKQWYQNNIERKKQYYLNNVTKILQQTKQRYEDNPECTKQYVKQWGKSLKLPYHIVYLLPDHNYVGVTNRPYFRMANHKTVHNRNTDNWTELAKFNTRKEALKCEAEYHAQGYEGAK